MKIWFSLVFWQKNRHIFRNSFLLESFYSEINHIQKLTLQTTKLAILFIINRPLTYSGLDWEVNTHASASSFAYSCMPLLPSSCDALHTALILNTKITKKKKTPECWYFHRGDVTWKCCVVFNAAVFQVHSMWGIIAKLPCYRRENFIRHKMFRSKNGCSLHPEPKFCGNKLEIR